MHARFEGALRTTQVRRKHRHMKAGDRQCMGDNFTNVGHLGKQLRGHEGTNLDFLQPRGGQRRNPTELGSRRHDGRDALKAITRANFADKNLGCRGNIQSKLPCVVCLEERRSMR
jgi:hypothetical protein